MVKEMKSIASWVFAAMSLAASSASVSADTPCDAARDAVKAFFDPLDPEHVASLLSCIAMYKYCVLTDGGKIAANEITTLQASRDIASAALVRVEDGYGQACLVSLYSGGSTAAWMFKAWRGPGRPMELQRFSKSSLNADNVPPSALVTFMIDRYKRVTREK